MCDNPSPRGPEDAIFALSAWQYFLHLKRHLIMSPPGLYLVFMKVPSSIGKPRSQWSSRNYPPAACKL